MLSSKTAKLPLLDRHLLTAVNQLTDSCKHNSNAMMSDQQKIDKYHFDICQKEKNV